MKRLFTLLLFAAALSWSGCTKDNNDNTIDPAQLVGTWELTKDYYAEYDEWDEEWGAEFGYILTIEFRADGTAKTHYEETDYSSDREYTYTIESKMLTMTDLKDPDYPEIIRIEKLTSSELVLAYDYEGEDGKTCTDKEYYKRIN